MKAPRKTALPVLALLLWSPAAAAMETTPEIAAFEHFIRQSGQVCETRPADVCVDKGLSFADRNRDGGIGLEELKRIRQDLLTWTQWRGDSLAGAEKLGIATGVWLVDSVGLEKLFSDYDADGDARLSKAELLTDVTLDERPLGDVLTDPEAVDRKALAARLGKLAPLLGPLLGPAN